MIPLLRYLAAVHHLHLREVDGLGWCCALRPGHAVAPLGRDAGRAIVRLLSIAACVSPSVGVA